MAFKKRRLRRAEAAAAKEGRFQHASGYADLAGVIGDHTLDAAQEAAAIAPKGYRARSTAKSENRR
jgi:hypothetical protein